MITRFVEATDLTAYGKFIVARLDEKELLTPSAMPEAEGAPLMTYGGHRRFNARSTMVIDLQRGTGAVWFLHGGVYGMRSYLREHLNGLEPLVCPMYLEFVTWLHEQGTWAMGEGDLAEIPAYLELGVAMRPERGYTVAQAGSQPQPGGN